ncbi:complex I subunit 5 family protein [Xanthobacter sp. DSM 24535]|uniref:complex I subunit 5 family protein n=1 Tax=Roseixanthobacter psychrophilus TaxID=3119917 RepID=UPI00372BC904
MTAAALLLVAAPVLPLLLALACALKPVRRFAPFLLAPAAVPGLLAALLVPRGVFVLVAPPPFRISFFLDVPGAILLGASAVLWIAAGAYAASSLAKDPRRGGFCVWWLATLAGSFGVFIVADVASFYLAFALVSLAAYGLSAHDDTPEARRAGVVYLVLTLFGEAVLIAAFVMLASGSPDANPLIRDAVAQWPVSPWRDAILALLVVGFGLKMGLVPLHVWMPLAHSVAPIPASAVLSGIVVKAGVIGLLRFLPLGVALSGWGLALSAIGILTAYYGIALGLTQTHPKRVLAYSTISQMGVVAAVIGGALVQGDASAAASAAFYAANHILLKGALFLAVGIAAASAPGAVLPVLGLSSLLGLSLAGLPFTGGALAKLAIKGPMGEGTAGFLLALSAAGTTLLMARFVLLLRASAKGRAAFPLPAPALLAPWIGLSILALALPFTLYPLVTGERLAAAFALVNLEKTAVPVLIGLALAFALHRRGPTLPEVPAGDILVLAERLGPPLARGLDRLGALDGLLRRWGIAGVLLAGLVIALAAAVRAAP